jgi:hypothetical protein
MKWSLILNADGRHMFLRKFPSTRTNWDILRQNLGNKYCELPPNFRMKTITTCHFRLKL